MIDIDDENQRIFVHKICSKILSHPLEQIDAILSIDHDDYYAHYFIDELLQEVFQSEGVKVTQHYNPNSICIDYQMDTLNDTLPICKEWFQPHIEDLKRSDKRTRKEWEKHYEEDHPEYIMKNELIKKTKKIGFNYFIDFEWNTEQDNHHYGSGDLIFGSDYGVYIIIETEWLNKKDSAHARRSRIDARNKVKHQAQIYKQFAEEKFKNKAIKVIGASYTNDSKLRFVDNQDEEIAKMIEKHYRIYYKAQSKHIYLN